MKDYKILSDFKIVDIITKAICKVNKGKEYNPFDLSIIEREEVVEVLSSRINLSKEQLYFYFTNGSKSKSLKDDFLKMDNLYKDKEYYDVLTLVNEYNNVFILEKIMAIIFIAFSLVASVILVILQLYYGLIVIAILFLISALIIASIKIRCHDFSNVAFDLDTSKIIAIKELPYKIKPISSAPHKRAKNIELLGIKFYYNIDGNEFILAYLSNKYRTTSRRYFFSNKLNNEIIEKFKNEQEVIEYYDNTNLIRINNMKLEKILDSITEKE